MATDRSIVFTVLIRDRLQRFDARDAETSVQTRHHSAERTGEQRKQCPARNTFAAPASRPPGSGARRRDEGTACVAGPQPGVAVSSRGGVYPEQWEGAVDGRSFYFRERWDDWRIELDLKPSGRFANAVIGVDDGQIETKEAEDLTGEVIASGDTYVDGYGETLTQRAQFIVGNIRVHLARQNCTHHGGDLSRVRDILDEQMRWCPLCGAQLLGVSVALARQATFAAERAATLADADADVQDEDRDSETVGDA